MTTYSADEPSPDQPLSILIKDASTKEDLVNFTILMKTILPQYTVKESLVCRTHDEFEWLHNQISGSPTYAGIIVPPCPPRPDFSVNRESLAVYTDDPNSDTEEYKKMRQELEHQYLAFFKKAVSQHENMLVRMSKIPTVRTDPSFIEFLTFQEHIDVSKSATSFFKGIFSFLKKSIDDNIVTVISNVKEPDIYFDQEKNFLTKYCAALKIAISGADAMTDTHKEISNTMIKVCSSYTICGASEYTKLGRIQEPISIFFDKCRKNESRLATDEDLKLSETLRYHFFNSQACLDLLNRRIHSLISVDKSLKALEKAKQNNKNVSLADNEYQQNLKAFETISESAKLELKREEVQRAVDFQKNLVSYCELQIAQHKLIQKELQLIIDRIEAEDCL